MKAMLKYAEVYAWSRQGILHWRYWTWTTQKLRPRMFQNTQKMA